MFAHAFDLQAVGNVIAHVHVREQGVILEYGVDVALVRRQSGGLDAVDADGTSTRLLEASDQPQAGSLARARGAEHREELAVMNVDGHPVDGLDLGEVARNVGELDGKGHGAKLQRNECIRITGNVGSHRGWGAEPLWEPALPAIRP
ncbi:hypothetical protein D3C72_1305620 [compost metagenome]